MQNDKIGIKEKRKIKLQQEYSQLNRDELIAEIAKDEAVLKELRQRLGKNKQKLRKWLTLMG